MGMAAQLQAHPGSGRFFKSPRRMVEKDGGLVGVERGDELIEIRKGSFGPPGNGRIIDSEDLQSMG